MLASATVVCSFAHAAASSIENLLQLLRAEISIMKLVNHPNIIRMESVYESRQHIFIVMELHSGGELFDLVTGKNHKQTHLLIT